jgi:uncharacterized protein YqgC (DUF456 family)
MNQTWVEIVLFLVSVTGVMLNVFGLPGNFVPVIVSLIAVMAGDGVSITWLWFVIFLLIAASGEIMDQLTGILGAKKYGATRPGMVGAAIGGIIGAVLGTAVLPLIGSLAGMFAGCFAFTMLFELVFSKRSVDDGSRAGFGALLGKAAAVAYKFMAGFVMLILIGWRFWGRAG